MSNKNNSPIDISPAYPVREPEQEEQHLHMRRPSRLLSGSRRRPSRSSSNLNEPTAQEVPDNAQGPPVAKSRSTLQKLGIAPLINTGERGFDINDQAPRSPRSTVRVGSTVVKRDISKISKKKVSEVKQKAVHAGKQWHLLEPDDFYKELGSNRLGLTTRQVEVNQKQFGKNQLTPPPKVSFFVRLFQNLTSPFSLIMIFASILTFIITAISSTDKDARGETSLDTQSLALSCVLIGVAFLTSLFQTVQENASDNLMEALHSLTAESAWVYRRKDESSPSEMVLIPAEEIVPGDVVKLNLGEKVPADLRIMECADLKVNNAALTGENIDIKLATEAGHDDLFEAKNIARSGCNFTNGNGLGVVFAIGDDTFFGQIAKSATTAEKPDSLMRREVKRMVIIMAIGGAIFGFTFFGAAFGEDLGWIAAVIILVGLFVANIPEGLLPQITIALTITARKMFHHNVIVSSLEIIETLGAVSVICSDKTGTLTLNRMTVAHLVLGGEIVRTERAPLLEKDADMLNVDDAAKQAQVDGPAMPLRQIMRAIELNSDACFIEMDPAKAVADWVVKGDASETALLKFVQQRRMLEKGEPITGGVANPTDYIKAAREAMPRIAYLPFHSKNKYMASINRLGEGEQVVLVKGAAERVIARCSNFMEADGNISPLTEEKKRQLADRILDLARRAERVFGFAQMQLDRPDDFPFEDEEGALTVPLEGLTFLGMASMIDPPRPTVPGAIKDCHKAGIHVIMVTGDHPETAVAISKSLGLITLPLLSEAKKARDEERLRAGQQRTQQSVSSLNKDEEVSVVPDTKNDISANATSAQSAEPAFPDESVKAGKAEQDPNARSVNHVTETTVVEMDEKDEYEGMDLSQYSVVVTGDDITKFDQHDWDRVLSCKEHCFARTQPEQKQMIVWRLQERGQIVAMTGDGVNDAPALKAANVGVAVGSGTAVAKEAGQIIIADDDFNSIVIGVREGRIIFENLKKAVTFVISHALPELIPYILAFALNIPLAIETIVILLIDLGTDMLPGITIAYEDIDDRIMSLPPRGANDHLISPKVLIIGYFFAGLQITFFAYWNFFWVFIRGYDMSFNDLRGATQGTYRKMYVDLDSDMQSYYTNLCGKTHTYYDTRGGPAVACSQANMGDFVTWFGDVVSEAQAAYFIALSCMQFANCLSRRQQVMSTFDPRQRFNWRLVLSILFSVGFMCFFVYVPSVNEAFFLKPINPKHSTAALWGMGVMILIEEIRKFFCRRWPNGLVARLTLF